MSRLNEYLEAVKAGRTIEEDDNVEPGRSVFYNGKKYIVVSDEGDKLILKGIKGYVWKFDCKIASTDYKESESELINKPNMYGWIIDKDYITKKGEECYRVGKCTSKWHQLDKTNKIRFRCLDDDGEVYYGGWMVDNDNCDAQDSVLSYTMNDAGCTEVQVQRDGKWVTEIN